ncbi:RsmB/NOP family class I SAM-dependent RNA methyltransferase [Aquamicrobium segne]|uniref:RsmB/NOP family class I SAM-dependent RNA methyltransferase n=1 Tax=Aquamicrobium segne TaxID=469547 RepID=A0ABW0GVZ0_9HYPH
MRMGGRLAAAMEVLADIETRQRPAAEALRDWGRTHRFAGGSDRAAIGNIVYDALRHKRSSGWLFASDTPRALAFGALLLEWGKTPETINALLDGDKFAPPLLSESELQTLHERLAANMPNEARANCPDWCIPLLQSSYGKDWAEEGAALASRPPLDLRTNLLKGKRDTLLTELLATQAAKTEIAPHGIRIPPIEGSGRHPNVQTGKAFATGRFEVQDEGSQIVAELTVVRPGMQVLDYCAGAGGKSLTLSAMMDNQGQIFAHDALPARLAPIAERIKRAGSRNIQIAAGASGLGPLENRMDLVLVDAPCTGSGTWRRRPDTKWRLTRQQLDARLADQAGILDIAANYVKSGGLLAYVTCSIFPDENENQIKAFLARTPDFHPEDHAALWSQHFPGHENRVRIGTGISLSPARSGTDGFYFCALRRN